MSRYAYRALGLSAFFISSFLYASSLPQWIQPKAKSSIVRPQSIIKTHHQTNEHPGYTDFTGRWIGTCGQDEQFTIDIENDFITVTLSGMTYEIGGLKTESSAGVAHSTDFSHTTMRWDDEYQSLTSYSVYIFHSHADELGSQKDFLNTDISNATLSIKDGQLLIRNQEIEYENGVKVHEDEAICYFDRENTPRPQE